MGFSDREANIEGKLLHISSRDSVTYVSAVFGNLWLNVLIVTENMENVVVVVLSVFEPFKVH